MSTPAPGSIISDLQVTLLLPPAPTPPSTRGARSEGRAASGTGSSPPPIGRSSGPFINPGSPRAAVLPAAARRVSADGSNASAPPFDALTRTWKTRAPWRALAGASTAMLVPVNLVAGALRGAVEGPVEFGRAGNQVVKGWGGLIGFAVGLPAGVVLGAALKVCESVVEARRFMGRYAYVNSGLGIRSDSVETWRHVLTSIPQERVTQDTRTGRTIVTVGDLRIDVAELLSTLEHRGRDKNFVVAIKARSLPAGTLYGYDRDGDRHSIYVQSRIRDAETAGQAGLQVLGAIHQVANSD